MGKVAVLNDGLAMMERMLRTGSFLPKGVAYAIGEGRNGLQMVTHADLKKARIEKQKAHLKSVLSTQPLRRAGFVWTFWTPGLAGFAFRGWWAYLRTLEGDTALNFRGMQTELISKVMGMFPCGILPSVENLDLWMEAFATEHSHPGRFKKQGLALVWVTPRPHNRMEVE